MLSLAVDTVHVGEATEIDWRVGYEDTVISLPDGSNSSVIDHDSKTRMLCLIQLGIVAEFIETVRVLLCEC